MHGVARHHHDHHPHHARVHEERIRPDSRAAASRFGAARSFVDGSSLGAASVTSSTSQRLDISIVTAEGDKVTLNAAASSTASYLTYTGAVTGPGRETAVRAQSASQSASSAFSISVEGELSVEEAKDIAKALKAYASALKDAVHGRTQPALAHASQIDKLDDIASFDATYTIQKQLSVTAQAVATAGNAPPAAEAAGVAQSQGPVAE